VLYYPPPHLKFVSSLPCKIWVFNCTALHNSYSFKSVINRLFTLNIYRNVIFWIICLCQLIYNMKYMFKISVISTHTCFTSCTLVCQWCVNDVLLKCCPKRVAGTVAIYCADVMSNDVIGTQERQLSSSKAIKHKYLLVYYSEMKLLSEVLIILAVINDYR